MSDVGFFILILSQFICYQDHDNSEFLYIVSDKFEFAQQCRQFLGTFHEVISIEFQLHIFLIYCMTFAHLKTFLVMKFSLPSSSSLSVDTAEEKSCENYNTLHNFSARKGRAMERCRNGAICG